MVTLPPSKSIAARYLVATYFAGTLPADTFFEDNDDIMVLQQALLEIYSDEEPIDYGDTPLDVGASGTAMRFVTAVCASSPGADYVITGSPRLMQRPMSPLLDVLKRAGGRVEALGQNDCGPYRVKGGELTGGEFSIRGDLSSQFISAVMLAAPSWEKGVKLSFSTPLVSRPYVEMTRRLMEKFDVKVELKEKSVSVQKSKYVDPGDFRIEADWSSASFFYEAAALGVKNIELAHLAKPEDSLQGDAVTAALFEKLGVKSDFSKESVSLSKEEREPQKLEVDFKDCPDLVLPFGVACLCLGVPFRFTNVAHLRLKESDRLESLKEEALKLGFEVTLGEDYAEWSKTDIKSVEGIATISTHDDHRVAMAFAMASVRFGTVRIENPMVVEKSFTDFWNQIRQLGFECMEKDGVMEVTFKNNL